MSRSSASKELINELRLIYDKHDVNRTGKIDIRQLYQIMFDVGYAPTEGEVHEFMAEADEDDSSYIGFDAFIKMLAPKLNEMFSEENLGKAFAVFDRRKEGYFNAHDLVLVMTSMGQAISEADSMMLMADISGDYENRVYLQAFLDYLLSDTADRMHRS
ncbi:neo-calmodulin [Drosophila mojavensis]|uniref:EF-hand domain-containing protein n=1 Tax=Drosophila mojavensis TaxID=7230 RepID=B4KPB2_DROMO|nr:neo-calmodulin [Drosophila mojavensis]EDW09088.1 uncharacterized protein Dmoj_GI20321 [Drosophila mojavensis]